MTTPDTQLTEEEIQQQLSRDYVTGPQYFRGRPLAKWTMGLRDLVLKIVKRDDTAEFHDACALYILAEAAENDKATRARLIRETDDVDNFRAAVSISLDDWTPDDIADARTTVHNILSLAEAARVEVTKKKLEDAGAQSPTTTLLDSASSLDSLDPTLISFGG